MAGKAKSKVTVTFPPSWNQANQPPASLPLYKTGRPRAYQTVDDLEQGIEQYFQYCEQNKKMPNKAGLALSLGVSRETLNNYESIPEFLDAIKKAYAFIEDGWIQKLPYGHAAGNIFYLKNAFGYRDVVENPGGGTTINFLLAPEIAAKYGLNAKPAPTPVPSQDVTPPTQELPDGNQPSAEAQPEEHATNS